MNTVAFNLGRLFAIVEGIERAKKQSGEIFFHLPQVLSNPAYEMPYLIEKAYFWIGGMTKESGGLATYFRRQIEEILATVPEFPQTFTTEEKGEFFLGMAVTLKRKENDND